MNAKHLTTLAVLAAISIAAASWALHTSAPSLASDRRGQSVIPALTAKANDITGLSVRIGTDTFVMERRDNRFVATDSGYPVKTDMVRDVVAKSASLTFQEARTSDPARYGELGLADPGTDNGGKEITFRTAGGELASFIIGNTDATTGGAAGGIFVRLKGQPQTFLVRGKIVLPSKGRGEWFAPVDFGVKRREITKVELTGGGRDGVTLRPSTARKGEFILVDVPEDRTADHLKASLLPGLVDNFSFRDVRKATAPAAPDARRLVVETDEGLQIVLTSLGDPSEGWVHVTVEGTTDAARDKAKLITSRVEGYDFRLNSDQGNLGWTIADLSVAKG